MGRLVPTRWWQRFLDHVRTEFRCAYVKSGRSTADGSGEAMPSWSRVLRIKSLGYFDCVSGCAGIEYVGQY